MNNQDYSEPSNFHVILFLLFLHELIHLSLSLFTSPLFLPLKCPSQSRLCRGLQITAATALPS